LTTPRETIWELQPHTGAKHKILRKYLDAWFPILARYNRRIMYIDGFSGPGRYAGGEPGSPIIALEAAISHPSKLGCELVFLFIEEKSDRADHLKAEIAKLTYPSHIKVTVEHGEFATVIGRSLDELDATQMQMAPTFVLIDPFGFSGIPYKLIYRLLSKDKCEVLITFMVDSINRFLEHPDDTIRSHIVDTCGTPAALGIADGAGDRTGALRDLYQKQLVNAAKFVRYFELRDGNGRVVYYLFFATNNPLGHLRMKEAMWKVDPLGEYTFSDSTDPNQHVLFSDPSIEPLVSDLVSKFRGHGEIPAGVIESHVQDKTAYLRKHMGAALKELESAGRVNVAELKSGGQRRRPRTYPNEALVTFI
jgi:three-Cys-motif partner protein